MLKSAKSDAREAQAGSAKSRERKAARAMMNPLLGAAAMTATFSEKIIGQVDLSVVLEVLIEQTLQVRKNKLTSMEDMLVGQVMALNTLFLELCRRAGLNMGEHLSATEAYMRLGLKAQAQCRATIEALANIKNPPVIYARQANIASGPQQVNNNISCPKKLGRTLPNELLEAHLETNDSLGSRATSQAGRSHPNVEALGAFDRTSVATRQSKRQPQLRKRTKAAETES